MTSGYRRLSLTVTMQARAGASKHPLRPRLVLVCTAIVLCGLILPQVSGCGWFTGNSPEFVAVGIPSNRMTESAAEQVGQNWCWAACIQMVLSLRGVHCDQAEIVQKTFGKLVDDPGTDKDIADNLSGWFDSRSGKILLSASTIKGPPQIGMLFSYLRNRTPVILGVTYPGANIGHAVVATGAVFRIGEQGLVLESVQIRDPSPSHAPTHGKRALTAEEYRNTQFHFFIDVVKRR
jgi:hypothetical protein